MLKLPSRANHLVLQDVNMAEFAKIRAIGDQKAQTEAYRAVLNDLVAKVCVLPLGRGAHVVAMEWCSRLAGAFRCCQPFFGPAPWLGVARAEPVWLPTCEGSVGSQDTSWAHERGVAGPAFSHTRVFPARATSRV